MKILIANHTPIYGSGSGTYSAMLAKGMLKQGHEVCILTPESEQTISIPGVKIRTISFKHHLFPSFTGHPLSTNIYSELDTNELGKVERIWIEEFEKIKDEWDPDIAHIQHIWIVSRAALSAKLNTVATCHGSELHFTMKHSHIAEKCLPTLEQLNDIIFISAYVRNLAQVIFDLPIPGHVIPNPCDTHLFRPGPEITLANSKPHLGFVGRLVKYKNCELVLRCAAELLPDWPTLSVSVVGDGPMRARLEHLAKQLGLQQNVRFWGYLPQKELVSLYRSFDALIVPSHNEPFGLVALESVACGTAVVAAQSGGLLDLIHPPYITGFITNNLDDLVSKLYPILHRLYTISKSDCHEYIKTHYSIERYITNIELIYKRAL